MITGRYVKTCLLKFLIFLTFSVTTSCFPVICVVETNTGPVPIIPGQPRFHSGMVDIAHAGHTDPCNSATIIAPPGGAATPRRPLCR